MSRRRDILLFSLVCGLAMALYRLQSNPVFSDPPETSLPVFDTDDKETFISYITDANETIKYEAIQSVCDKKIWREDVVFNCDMIAGGIGNVRNHVLNCIRYVMEAGGSLIVPRIMRRNPQDISEIETRDWQDLEYMFDKTWFERELSTACPQLKLWASLDDVPAYKDGTLRRKRSLVPRTLDNWVPKYGLAHPEFWRGWFDEWVAKDEEAQEEGKIVHFVGLGRAYLEFPIRYDGSAFVAEFGKILRFNHNARWLAANLLWIMRSKFFSPSFSQNSGILKAGDRGGNATYFGIHLRTEADAVRAWPVEDWRHQAYSLQSTNAIRELHASGLDVVYVASGNVSEVARLARDIQNHANTTSSTPITVLTKHDLFDDASYAREKQILDAMTFDQAALVDFLVMAKAAVFVGIGHSSFAWNIAFQRHALVKHEKHYLDPGPQLLRDSLSVIFGDTRTNIEYAYCMWP
ncbi:hypothetical protein PVAG01_04414 [Phlyctema vagabunda]|uniref:Alternative oxidase n=1 Tax=Phlyctema vagabunda TaxID=108571 RepID=A0ABR4PP32_9HELO